MSTPYTNPLPGGIPSTHKEHTESKTTILLPKDHSAFLNPPQQFNRDLSVAVIRAWNERRCEIAEQKWKAKQSKKAKKGKTAQSTEAKDGIEGEQQGKQGDGEGEVEGEGGAGPSSSSNGGSRFQVRNIRIIEALSATGLRSIRYAKEIPNVKTVLANDLSASACEAMKMNVAYNGVGEDEVDKPEGEGDAAAQDGESSKQEAGSSVRHEKRSMQVDENGDLPNGRRPNCKGKVRVNEGDACGLMYSHRDAKDRVEVVDLDPYGTAAPFIDAAISCITDGGLLCVTCTDTAVFAGSQYPEKSFANYGGASVNAEYCHEVGLRLVLNMLANAAARYGRCITPLLSFSIDFYVRVFVTVETAPVRVKELASNTGVVFVCSHCQSWEVQPFGRTVMSDNGQNKKFRSAQKTSKGMTCEFCHSAQHLGGPMWLGPIQDPDFAERCLKSIEGQQGDYATWTRMHGMLTIARNELQDPFYFTCNKVSSFFRSSSAPTAKTVSALLNAGYKVSRSHASAGSVKTDAPRSFVLDIIREFIKETPVKMDKIGETSPARVLLAKEQTHKIDFTPHKDLQKFEKGDKVVFYQSNPANWGPAARAKNIVAKMGESVVDAIKVAKVAAEGEGKRKSEDGEGVEQREEKKAKVEVEPVRDEEEEAMNL